MISRKASAHLDVKLANQRHDFAMISEVFGHGNMRFTTDSLRPSMVTESLGKSINTSAVSLPRSPNLRFGYLSSDSTALRMSLKEDVSARKGFYTLTTDTNVAVQKPGRRLKKDSLARAKRS